jgi:hypothetical protein
MVASVCHEDFVISIDGDPPRIAEFALAGARATNEAHMLQLLTQNLHSVIVPLRNENAAT